MSVTAPELRACPVPVSEPWPATSAPTVRVRRDMTQDVLPLGAAHPLALLGAPGVLRASARSRRRHVPASAPVAMPWEEDDGPRPTPVADLPDARGLATTIVSTTLEALAGARPASQLLRWMASDVHAHVAARCAAASARRRPGTPVPRTAVTKMRSCCPCDNAVEIAAVVIIGTRVKALAMRMEGWDGRWRVTALELR